MNVKELVGKKAIRTSHVVLAGGRIDRSYMETPMEILKVTDSHIVCKIENYQGIWKNHILPCEWVDDNWADYDELMNGIEE